MKSLKLIRLIKLIKSSQVMKESQMKSCVHKENVSDIYFFYSVVCILRERRQNYLSFLIVY